MSTVNLVAREVAAKIVFYGPGLSGKTTSLRRVYESVRPAHRGEMMSLATEGDRTLFFDFLPVKVERVGDCTVRLALYTVPGQVFYNATRKHVLQGADGVVFVADSQPEAMDNNRESFANLEENLLEQGIRLSRFPHVLQWNKRDLPGVLPVAALAKELNRYDAPAFESCAATGQGVLDVIKSITRAVIKDLRQKRIVSAPRGLAQKDPERSGETSGRDDGGGLEAQLQQHLKRPTRGGGGPSTTRAVNPAGAERPTPGSTPPGSGTSREGSPALSPSPRAAPSKTDAGTGREDAVAPTASGANSPTPSDVGATRGDVGATDRRGAPSPIPASGLASALAPSELLDHARAADAAFALGDWEGCVRACHGAVRRGLAATGEASLPAQAFFLRIDGEDLLRLQTLSTRSGLGAAEAAFAVYVAMQTFTRLTHALPEQARVSGSGSAGAIAPTGGPFAG